jgi:predicted dienelactone hydrolase
MISCGENDSLTLTGTAEPTSAISRSECVWVDRTRVTPRTSAFPGAPDRTLRVLIWAPHASGPLPLLIMAHGFGGLPEKFDAFARSVAAAGFLVAAPAFPLTNENAPGGHESNLRDLINQPADLRFVLTQLLDATVRAGDPLSGHIAANQVAVLGHSIGAVTVLALTRKTCCQDDRVRASVIVSALEPLVDIVFGGAPLSPHGPPTLILHGTADESAPYSNAPLLYGLIDPPRVLVGLLQGTHSELLESQVDPPVPARDAAQRATIAFLDALFRGRAPALEQTLAALAAAGNEVRKE